MVEAAEAGAVDISKLDAVIGERFGLRSFGGINDSVKLGEATVLEVINDQVVVVEVESVTEYGQSYFPKDKDIPGSIREQYPFIDEESFVVIGGQMLWPISDLRVATRNGGVSAGEVVSLKALRGMAKKSVTMAHAEVVDDLSLECFSLVRIIKVCKEGHAMTNEIVSGLMIDTQSEDLPPEVILKNKWAPGEKCFADGVEELFWPKSYIKPKQQMANKNALRELVGPSEKKVRSKAKGRVSSLSERYVSDTKALIFAGYLKLPDGTDYYLTHGLKNVIDCGLALEELKAACHCTASGFIHTGESLETMNTFCDIVQKPVATFAYSTRTASTCRRVLDHLILKANRKVSFRLNTMNKIKEEYGDEVHNFVRKMMSGESDSNVWLICGPPGSGKTRLNLMIQEDLRSGWVLAPSNIAAISVNGVTEYSFLRCTPSRVRRYGEAIANALHDGRDLGEVVVPSDLMEATLNVLRLRIREAGSKYLYIVHDEIFFVDFALVYLINLALKKNFNSRLPFAGMLVIWFGGADQLESPSKRGLGTSLHSMGLFLLKENVLMLKKVFRQTSTESKIVCDAIRKKISSPRVLDLLESRVRGSSTTVSELNSSLDEIFLEAGEKPIILCCFRQHRFQANELVGIGCENINEQQIGLLQAEKTLYKSVDMAASAEGKTYLNDNHPFKESITLCPGARVMLVIKYISGTRTLPSGTMGTVQCCGDGHVFVMFDGIARAQCVQSVKLEMEFGKEDELISREQLPFILGWAMTIHRSQSLTLISAILAIRGAFSPGQLNVAFSRARSLENIYILGRRDSDSTAMFIRNMFSQIKIPAAVYTLTAFLNDGVASVVATDGTTAVASDGDEVDDSAIDGSAAADVVASDGDVAVADGTASAIDGSAAADVVDDGGVADGTASPISPIFRESDKENEPLTKVVRRSRRIQKSRNK